MERKRYQGHREFLSSLWSIPRRQGQSNCRTVETLSKQSFDWSQRSCRAGGGDSVELSAQKREKKEIWQSKGEKREETEQGEVSVEEENLL